MSSSLISRPTAAAVFFSVPSVQRLLWIEELIEGHGCCMRLAISDGHLG
jgi:hypothetical protein